MKRDNKESIIKKEIKLVAGLEIWLLVVSILGFSFIMNMRFVSGEDNLVKGKISGIFFYEDPRGDVSLNKDTGKIYDSELKEINQLMRNEVGNWRIADTTSLTKNEQAPSKQPSTTPGPTSRTGSSLPSSRSASSFNIPPKLNIEKTVAKLTPEVKDKLNIASDASPEDLAKLGLSANGAPIEINEGDIVLMNANVGIDGDLRVGIKKPDGNINRLNQAQITRAVEIGLIKQSDLDSVSRGSLTSALANSKDKINYGSFEIGQKIGKTGWTVTNLETDAAGNIVLEFTDKETGQKVTGYKGKTDTDIRKDAQKNLDVGKEPGMLSGVGSYAGRAVQGIVKGAIWAVSVSAFSALVISFLDLDADEEAAITKALAAGAFTLGVVDNLSPKSAGSVLDGGWQGTNSLWSLGKISIALGVAAYVYYSQYKTEKTAQLQFMCLPWQAPTGGNDCDKCNDEEIPCSEYRCKSLGQACGIINAGTDEEKCIWMHPSDASSPGIDPWEGALTAGYDYSEVKSRPEGGRGGTSGMKIVRQGGGCVEAFTKIEFGIVASEEAQCKIDVKHTENYDQMSYYLGNSNLYMKNHSQIASVPSKDVVENMYPEIENNNEYTWYIRCKDGNGNENEDEFVVRFCVDEGPDLTAPEIKSTDPINNAPVNYQADNITVSIYVTEPAECRWTRQGSSTSYLNMENDFTCRNELWEMNSEMLYKCTAQLTSIQDRQENNFYFRCKDKSPQENEMQESYKYVIKGTQPLNILEVGPNETIGGSTSVITTTLTVKTDNGYNNGESRCYYSETGESGSYIQFFNTNSYLHSQNLDLVEGTYKYYIKCVDLGGNTDTSVVEFSIYTDDDTPRIIRAYFEGDKVKIITNEESTCVYNSQGCNYDFDEGINMPYNDKTDHYAEWIQGQSYYIKCKDKYDNQPNPNSCSIIVKSTRR